ncbi:MAG: hypothetical protein LC637_03095 [Xanthomonadaceae bacterium]|nr:hypothetical protein [Xanthomonadaceae bacterium]
MKIVKTRPLFTGALFVALGCAGCFAWAGQSAPIERLQAVSNLAASGNEVLPDVADYNCNLATPLSDPDTELFLVEFTTALGLRFGSDDCDPSTDLTPLLDPAGNPITLWDWSQATGRVSIQCVEAGTRYHFKFKGLIPDGLYSLWHFPGSGGGALASHRPDDINNVFTANPAGNANFVVVGTAGNMNFGGSVGACTLPTSENIGSGYDFVGGLGDALFLLEYHNDQRTHGPLPGPFNTFAAPLAFVLDLE